MVGGAHRRGAPTSPTVASSACRLEAPGRCGARQRARAQRVIAPTATTPSPPHGVTISPSLAGPWSRKCAGRSSRRSQVQSRRPKPTQNAATCPQLDDLSVREMRSQHVVGRVGDREVVRGHELRIGQRGALRFAEILRLLGALERAHKVLVHSGGRTGPIAHRHATATLVVERDAQPNERGAPPAEARASVSPASTPGRTCRGRLRARGGSRGRGRASRAGRLRPTAAHRLRAVRGRCEPSSLLGVLNRVERLSWSEDSADRRTSRVC